MNLSINKFIILLHCIYIYPNKPITYYSKKLNITYSHIHGIIKELIKINMIYKTKNKRCSILSFTPKGEKFGKQCSIFFTSYTTYIL